MSRFIASAVFSFLLGASNVGLAQMCDRGIAVRINNNGLDFVVNAAKDLVPKQLALSPIDAVVVDWPLTSDDARVQIDGMVLDLELKDMRLYLVGDSLHIAVTGDIAGERPVKVLNPYVGFGTADCYGVLKLVDFQIDIGAQLRTANRIEVDVRDAQITFDNQRTEFALKECVIGSVITTVVDFIRAHFNERLEQKLSEMARTSIPKLVEQKLSEAIEMTGSFKGFSYVGRLDGVATDPNGIDVLLGAAVEPSVPNAPCLAGANATPPASCEAIAPPLDKMQPAMFGAGVSEGFFNETLHALWRSGMFCVDSNELAAQNPQLGQSMETAARSLKLPPTTSLSFQLQIKSPPIVHLTASSGVAVTLPDLNLQLSLIDTAGPPGQINVSCDATVAVSPSVSPRSGGIVADLKDVALSKVQIVGADGSALPLDPARIERFIKVVGLPSLQQKLNGIDLTPAVISVKDYLIQLRHTQVGEGYIAAYIDAYQHQPTGDNVPPEVLLVEAPAGVVGPQMVGIYVNGQDNATPPGLLRYSYSVDNGPWSEPSFVRRIDAAVSSGQHEVQIVAIDLEENRTQIPLTIRFEVDAEPPTIQITQRPERLLEEGGAGVGFNGSDDRSSVSFRVDLYRLPDGGGVPTIVQTRDYAAGVSTAYFEGLDSGVYRIRVTARDEAGNVSSEEVGFVVELAGCAIGGGVPTRARPPLYLLLLPVVLLVRRRRRRR